MNAPASPVRIESLRIAGEKVACARSFEVRYPYTGEVIATAPKATVDDVRRAFAIARRYRSTLTRHDRYRILMRAAGIIAERREVGPGVAAAVELLFNILAFADHGAGGKKHLGLKGFFRFVPLQRDARSPGPGIRRSAAAGRRGSGPAGSGSV